MRTKLILFSILTYATINAQVTIKSVKTFGVGASIDDAVTMCATPDLLYFGVNNNSSTDGVEPWTSDGTTAGTKLLVNLNPSYSSSNPRWFKQALGKVIFVADVTTTTAPIKTVSKLFITDGTAAGTTALCDLSFNFPASVSVTNSIFYGKELNGKYYFSAETTAEEAELWVTDGTAAGTKMVKDINLGNYPSAPRNFEILGDKLYFTANTSMYGEELWVTDGTEAGTTIVKDILQGSNGQVTGQLINYKNKLYFAANDGASSKGKELWSSDGTEAGTVMVKDINAGTRNSNPINFYTFNNYLYFNATTAESGAELWVTDGTADNTTLVQDLNPGTTSSSPSSFETVGNYLFFVAKDATYGSELRKLAAGTNSIELVKDINVGTADGVHPTFYADSRYITLGRAVLGNNMVFTACDNSKSYYQVWITDGTTAGTTKLLYSNTPGSNNVGFTAFKNEVYFWGNYYTKYELYKVSGIPADIHSNRIDAPTFLLYQQGKNLVVRGNEIASKLEVAIYSTQGSLIRKVNLENNTVSISDLKPGCYVVQISSNNKLSTHKVLIR